MAITRSQIARQLLAEGGVSLDDAKRMAPEGEFLAYINPKEAQMLKDAGGSGIMTRMGIPSFSPYGEDISGQAYASYAQTPGDAGGDGGGNDPIQDQIQSRPVPKKSFFDTVSDVGKNIAGVSIFGPAYAGFQLAKKINPDIFKFNPNVKPPVTPPGDDDNETQVTQPIMPIMPMVPKLPTDIEPPKSDFVQRFILPERFRLAEGGDVSVKDAEKMAPQGEFLAYINDDEAALLKSLGGAGKAVNETGIPSFFVKKLFKKAKKAVKKVVKSDLGKAALAAAALYYGGGGNLFGLQRAGMSGFSFGNLPGASFFGKGSFNPFKMAQNPAGRQFGLSKFGSLANKLGIVSDAGKLTKLGKAAGLIGGAATVGGLAAGAGEEDDETIDDVIGRISDQTGLDVQQIRKEVQDAYAKGDISSLASKYPFLVPTGSAMAEGGIARLGYQEGGDIQKQAEEAMKEGFPRYFDDKGNEISLEKFLKDAAEADKKMVMPKRKPPKEVQKRKEKNFKKIKPALEKESADMVEDLIRSKKAGGGLMNLGGMEMDLRGGGFVPIGAKEKADDVPARLSKNEFVFTADAVRAAGGGSVEKGAQKMYNTMKQLEDSIA